MKNLFSFFLAGQLWTEILHKSQKVESVASVSRIIPGPYSCSGISMGESGTFLV